MSVNSATISGNIGAEPVLRTTPAGTSVLTFSVAVNESVKGSSGDWEQRTSWITAVVFGPRAASLKQHLDKGTKVTVQGRLRENRWTGPEGGKHSRIELAVDEIDWAPRPSHPSQPAPAQVGYHVQDVLL